jgi:membrane fusion protein (multidrug efflux system)
LPSDFSRTSRALALESGRPAQVALALAGVCLAGWLGWFTLGRVTVYEVSRRARLEAAITARDVSPVEAGRIVGSSLQIGRRVHAGDILVELDAESERLQLAEETARLTGLPLKIATARAQAEALEKAMSADRGSTDAALRSAQAREREGAAAVDLADEKERRIRTLAASGLFSDVEALRYATEARKARSNRDALKAEGEKAAFDAKLSQRRGEADIAALRQSLVAMEADLDASRATAARLQTQIENRRIRAPADGVVSEVQSLAPGAVVAAGQKLATIVPAGGLSIVAEFPPAYALGRLKVGQSARLRLDGYPWAQYGVVNAKVIRVAGEPRDGLLRADLVALPASASRLALRHGMTGAAEVAVEQLSPADLVLRAAGQWLSPQGVSR